MTLVEWLRDWAKTDGGEMTLAERLEEAARWTPTYSDTITEAQARIEQLEAEVRLLKMQMEGFWPKVEAYIRQIADGWPGMPDWKMAGIARRALEEE